MSHQLDFKRIPKVPELRNRLLFTLAMLAVYRIGVYISIPGMDRAAMADYLGQNTQGAGGFLNMFNFLAGGALEQLSIFALGLCPTLPPRLSCRSQGSCIRRWSGSRKSEAGRKKINQLTRYFTLVLALVQGTALGGGLNALTNQEVVRDTGMSSVFLIVLTPTADGLLMWLGEEITAKGVGNGISLLIMVRDRRRAAFGDVHHGRGCVCDAEQQLWTGEPVGAAGHHARHRRCDRLRRAGNAASRSSTPGERSVAVVSSEARTSRRR